MAMFDAFALAMAVAARTQRAGLTVGPLAVGVRTPVSIAMGIGSVAALTGRRVDVALGTSSPVVVGQWHGRDRARGVERLDETAEALRGVAHGPEGRLPRPRRLDHWLPAAGAVRGHVDHRGRVRRPGDRGGRAPRRPPGRPGDPGERHKAAVAAGRCGRRGRPPDTAHRGLGPGRRRPSDAAMAQFRRAKVGNLAVPGHGEMFTDSNERGRVRVERRELGGIGEHALLRVLVEPLRPVIAVVGELPVYPESLSPDSPDPSPATSRRPC